MPERRGGHPRGNNYYAFKRGYKSVDFPLWINVMSSLCYLRKLFDKNVASGTSIIFSINARVKKKISIPITRASWKKKTITKDCRGYNYKKKNAEYEISRKANNIDKQIRAYALVSSFTEFMITQPKAIGGRAIVKWRSITRIYIYT